MFNLIRFEKIRTSCGKYSGYLLLGLPDFFSRLPKNGNGPYGEG